MNGLHVLAAHYSAGGLDWTAGVASAISAVLALLIKAGIDRLTGRTKAEVDVTATKGYQRLVEDRAGFSADLLARLSATERKVESISREKVDEERKALRLEGRVAHLEETLKERSSERDSVRLENHGLLLRVEGLERWVRLLVGELTKHGIAPPPAPDGIGLESGNGELHIDRLHVGHAEFDHVADGEPGGAPETGRKVGS